MRLPCPINPSCDGSVHVHDDRGEWHPFPSGSKTLVEATPDFAHVLAHEEELSRTLVAAEDAREAAAAPAKRVAELDAMCADKAAKLQRRAAILKAGAGGNDARVKAVDAEVAALDGQIQAAVARL